MGPLSHEQKRYNKKYHHGNEPSDQTKITAHTQSLDSSAQKDQGMGVVNHI